MSSITAFLTTLGPWNWFVVAVLLLALETVVPGVHFLWFGLAAAAVGIIAIALGAADLATGFGRPVQVIVFAVLSVATVFFVRRWTNPAHTASDLPDLNARAAQYIGRTFVVVEPIAGGRGKIKVGDSLWAAQGPDSPAGAQVKVTAAQGTVLIVELAA
jgi:membrane protein implicated in regulation of membrane protease activity